MNKLLSLKSKFPLSLTIKITNSCNSKCQTCFIWKQKSNDELTFTDYKIIITNSKIKPLFLTITGGEPFLRSDFLEILNLILKKWQPKYLTIATNGLLTEVIVNFFAELKIPTNTKIFLNFSLDGTEKVHNSQRGIINGFQQTLKTIKILQQKKIKNLYLGIGHTLTKYNLRNFKEFSQVVKKINIDSFSLEIYQQRKELFNTQNHNLTISYKEYQKLLPAIKNLSNSINKVFIKKISRNVYYEYILYLLKNPQDKIFTCSASKNSFYLNYNGEVWDCPVKGRIINNTHQEFNLGKIFKSNNARQLSKIIKQQNCACFLANSFYVALKENPAVSAKIMFANYRK